MGAPSGESLSGLFLEVNRRVAPNLPPSRPPIRPQLSWVDARFRLEQPHASAIVLVCFATRKRNEAWSPGNFGCRGLLLCAERARVGARQLQPLRPVGQRIFVAVGAVEQQHALVLPDQPTLQRPPP